MKIKCFAIILLIVLITVVFGSFAVFADELDSNAIYNFNQIYQNPTFNSDSFITSYGATYSVNDSVIVTNDQYNSGVYLNSTLYNTNHKYYIIIRLSSSLSTTVYVACRSSRDNIINTQVDVSTYNLYIDYGINASSYGGVTYITSDSVDFIIHSFSCIDLTQMFGTGKEPTLEQCEQIFTADYYNYNTGTSLTLNGVNAYQQGVDDTLDGLQTLLTFKNFSKNAYPSNVNGYNSTLSLSTDPNVPDFMLINGYIVLPLLGTVNANSYIDISFSLVDVNGLCEKFQIGYIYDNSFVPLLTVNGSDISTDPEEFSYYNFLVSCPVALSNIVVFADYLGQMQTLGFGNMVVEYKLFNNSIIVDNAYNSGYDNGFNAGNNQGYSNGYTAGLNAATENDYSFFGLLSAVVRAPVTVLVGDYDIESGQRVGGLLNFEILGYNMSTFLMSLFSLSIVVCIVRLFI